MCGFCRARKAQRAEEVWLFRRGIGCAIGWIDTEGDDVIILSGDHVRLLQTLREAVEYLWAHHCAFVVHEREHRRAMANPVTQRGRDVALVGEGSMQRYRLIATSFNPTSFACS